ncbi:ubiquitin-like domain-containing protein CIP73 [Telopea speciosissima]|uniref:ubiquitin-like domain-containing protein CIP73 n=1 Tax=Telopea speciosissima TaxID=54955 RepID=UPI001CC797DB|nr:ubiquitin-like domain-containing protein CIP73 [Telopea speciosissima]
MGSNGADEVMVCGDEAECSEATVEIKIKTLDSQTYTLRVNKRMPVPALKDQIATVTGVVSEQQRLICRGKVLKDDQLLSAYHVEDGHTLHLVVRQPIPPSSASTMGFMGSESLPDHPATDPTLSAGQSQGNHVAHSVVLGTFNIADQGDGVIPDLNRIISTVLTSVFSNIGSGSEGVNHREPSSEGHERTSGASGLPQTAGSQPEQSTTSAQSAPPGFRIPAAISLGPLHPPVIPDSLNTLSQYLSHMMHEFSVNGGSQNSNAQVAGIHGSEAREPGAPSHLDAGQELLPTPAALAEVMLSTRQMLIDQAGECLLQLARQLEDQANVTDPLARMSIQSTAMRSGILLQNLGALLLELGRTTMTLRMGRAPSEAVVNAGPAVFISTSGPNPIMVQPLPFQPGTNFGAIPMGAVNPGSGLVGGTLGSGFLPRNIDIRIRTGSSISTASTNQGEQAGVQQPQMRADTPRSSGGATFVHQVSSGASGNLPFTGDSGVRVVPIRTVVAAVPAPISRPPSSTSGGSVGLFYPLLARVQHVTSGNSNNARGSQVASEHQPGAPETRQQPVPAFSVQEQNMGSNIFVSVRDGNSAATVTEHQQGSFPTSSSRQPEPSNSSNNILPSDGTQSGHGTSNQIPNRLDELLRTIFPGEHIRVSDISFQPMATTSSTESAGTTRGAVDAREAVAGVDSDEGLFFSNLLRQIMPYISQIGAAESNVSLGSGNNSEHTTAHGSSTQAEENPDVGTSCQHGDPPTPPNSKRQKRE